MAGFFGRGRENTADIRKFKFSLIAYYAFIIIGITSFISVSTIIKTDDVLKSKVSELAADLNVQMQMNLDSYLSRVETMAALVFAEKVAYTYDATDANNDEYEALNTENSISDKLYSLCLMENFVDFSIVYSNNHVVGKLSNNTKDLFGSSLYDDLAGIINRERTHDGWLAGYSGNYNRIYYVKRVNSNAVLLTSFYATELESVFEHPGGIADITIRLVEDNDVMIYSSVDGEMGSIMSDDISKRVSGHDSATLMDDDYLITVNPSGDNWRVISSVPTQIILKEKNTVQGYILGIGAIAAIIAIGLSMILSFGVSSSVGKKFTTLNEEAHVDQLTGVLNKRFFEVRVDTLLQNAEENMQYALLLIDIDNFKSVNDTFGHAYGDKVLADVGESMRSTFRSEDSLGRLGGDEFCVFMGIKGSMSEEERNRLIHRKCSELLTALRKREPVGDKEYRGSASVGVALYPRNGTSFAELYKMADSALYATKRKGKDNFTIDGEEN
ncbi:MAG: GGDEF domain-containing protein [Christensenellaceae bacterium]|nr:GGDEF domain-containing protein [Christensenellaceae bacterium]